MTRKILKRKYPDCWHWISLAGRIPGQLTEREAYLLFHLARARTRSVEPVIVELGTRQCQASLLLAAGLRAKITPRLLSFQHDGIGDAFHRLLRRCRLRHIVDATSDHFGDGSDGIDFLFVNATEDWDTLHGEFLKWSALVRRGGIVALHGFSKQCPALLPPQYGELRQVDNLTWAVKERTDASATLPSAMSQEVQRLERLVNRSIEIMLRLNSLPAAMDSPSSNPIGHLEQAVQIARARLQDYIRRGAKELAENRHAVEALRESWSWRLTRPLRFGVETLQAIAGILESFMHGSFKARIVGLTHWMLFQSEVRASGLFDESYYKNSRPDAGWARTTPLLHFFVRGASEGRNPNQLFDIEYYLACYPEVARSGVNPLLHYLRDGAYQGHNPHPHFDSGFYLEQNPDVREGRLNPLAHYLAPGIAEGRDPNPWFDTSEYLEENPDVAVFGLNPLAHQLEAWSNNRLCSR